MSKKTIYDLKEAVLEVAGATKKNVTRTVLYNGVVKAIEGANKTLKLEASDYEIKQASSIAYRVIAARKIDAGAKITGEFPGTSKAKAIEF